MIFVFNKIFPYIHNLKLRSYTMGSSNLAISPNVLYRPGYYSHWFSVDEMCHSDTAVRRDIDNTPDLLSEENLRNLCIYCLDPLREALKQSIIVNSGFRCEKLNIAVGGSKYSQHKVGQAADIKSPPFLTEDLFNIILESENIVFDQLIQEFNTWIHISYNIEKNRRIITRATKETINGKRKTKYQHFERTSSGNLIPRNTKFYNKF